MSIDDPSSMALANRRRKRPGREASGTGEADRAQAASLAVQAKALAESARWRVWVDLTRTWTIIAAVLALCVLYPTPVVLAIAFVVVAAQQYALLILLHDGQHS